MVRGDRTKIYAAQRTGMRNRLLLTWHLPETRVDVLLAEWEAEAERRGLHQLDREFWLQAEAWLASRRG